METPFIVLLSVESHELISFIPFRGDRAINVRNHDLQVHYKKEIEEGARKRKEDMQGDEEAGGTNNRENAGG